MRATGGRLPGWLTLDVEQSPGGRNDVDYELAKADIIFDAFQIALTEIGGDIELITSDATNLMRSLIITTATSRREEISSLSGADISVIAGSAVSLYRLLRRRQRTDRLNPTLIALGKNDDSQRLRKVNRLLVSNNYIICEKNRLRNCKLDVAFAVFV